MGRELRLLLPRYLQLLLGLPACQLGQPGQESQGAQGLQERPGGQSHHDHPVRREVSDSEKNAPEEARKEGLSRVTQDSDPKLLPEADPTEHPPGPTAQRDPPDIHLDSSCTISARGAISTRGSLGNGKQDAIRAGPAHLSLCSLVLPSEAPGLFPLTNQSFGAKACFLTKLCLCSLLSPKTTFHCTQDLELNGPSCQSLLQGTRTWSGWPGMEMHEAPLLRKGLSMASPTAHLSSRFTSRTSQARRTHGARGTSVSRCTRSSLLAGLTLKRQWQG